MDNGKAKSHLQKQGKTQWKLQNSTDKFTKATAALALVR